MSIKRIIKYLFITVITFFIITNSLLISSYAKEEAFLSPIHNFVYLKPQPSSTDWNLILVNPWNSLDKNFNVELNEIEIVNGNTHYIDIRIRDDLENMINDMIKEGLSPCICSSYRTYEKQEILYENKIKYYLKLGYSYEIAKEKAGEWVAMPGTSEHQTGLAIDIVDINYQLLDKNQENTNVQKWLMENSYKYGFILRYPENKKHLTGINYEPWHYRYIGKENAKKIHENQLCLEEYIEIIKNKQFSVYFHN